MPKEIFPSSFECDCGHQSDFSENTVRDMKAMSQKKKVYLADSAPEEHTIVFYRGKMVEIQCPKQPPSRETRKSHIPPNLVVRGITAHRKPPDVRIWRLRNQSRVGTFPPSTSTPHCPACWARR